MDYRKKGPSITIRWCEIPGNSNIKHHSRMKLKRDLQSISLLEINGNSVVRENLSLRKLNIPL